MSDAARPADDVVRWAADAIAVGAEVVGVEQLRTDRGPWLVRVQHGDAVTEVVLKTGPIGLRAELATEAAALALAAEHGLPVPRLLAVDLDGRAASTIALVTTVLAGRSDVPSTATTKRLRAVGAAAAMVHQIPLTPRADLPLRTRHMPWVDLATERRWAVRYQAAKEDARAAILEEFILEHPGWSRDESHEVLLSTRFTPLLIAADERLRTLPVPEDATVFVHGDLWQGNMLWSGDEYGGMIDWEAAGAGHYGVDLGSLRLDAAILFGSAAPNEVLPGWEEASGRNADRVAYWDVVAALNTSADMSGFLPTMHEAGRTDLDGDTLTHRRDAFLRAALDELGLPFMQ